MSAASPHSPGVPQARRMAADTAAPDSPRPVRAEWRQPTSLRPGRYDGNGPPALATPPCPTAGALTHVATLLDGSRVREICFQAFYIHE